MKRGVIVAVGVVIALVLLLPILAGVTRRFGSGASLQHEYDRIRAEGLPLTFDELDAWYERPADDAADLYLRAFDAHVDPSFGIESSLPWEKSGAKLPPEGQPLPDAMRQAIQQYVRSNSGAISLLREAVTHPHCRYPIDLRKGFAAELSHLAKIRSSARLLADQAVLLADTGDPGGAVESLVGVFTLANTLETEPVLISQLVRAACIQIGLDALAWVTHRTSMDGAQSAKLAGAIEPFSNECTYWRAYAGEQSMLIAEWDARMGPGPEALTSVMGLDIEAVKEYTQGAVFEDDLAYMLRILDLVIQAAKLPPEEGQSIRGEAEKLLEETPSDYLLTTGKGPFENRTNMGGFVHALERRESLVAACRTAAAALGGRR